MAGNLTENFNELCRLCASKINVLIGINIFEGAGNIREINKKISICLPIQVHEADHLPKMICRDCVYNLDLFFTFREKTIQTESLLLDLVKKLDCAAAIEKPKEIKLLNESVTMDIVTTIAEQQLNMVPNQQQLLDHTNMALSHDLRERENIMVNQEEMILDSHDNMAAAMHNHELEHIDIVPNELNSHEMSHESLHSQQLTLHDHHDSAMAQLVQQDMHISDSQLSVQNLELIHAQHNLITEHYESMQEKSVENNENCVKRQRELVTVKDEKEIKIENQIEMDTIKTMYRYQSDSDDSSDPDFDPSLENSGGENEKQAERVNNLADNLLYEEQKDNIVNGSGVGTSESNMPFYCNVCGKTINDREEYLNHYGEHLNKCLLCQAVFTNVDALKNHRKQVHPRRPPNRNSKSHKTTKSRGRLKTETKPAVDDNFFKEESSDEDESSVIRNNTADLLADEEEEEEDGEGDTHEDGGSNGGKRKRWEPKVCQECGKSYKTNYKLQEHMRKHTGEQPYKCSMCDKAFRSKIGLAQHEAKHTGFGSKPNEEYARETILETSENNNNPSEALMESQLPEDEIVPPPEEDYFYDSDRDPEFVSYIKSSEDDISSSEENSLASNIPPSSSKSNRQRDFCFFCESSILNFARHIIRKHSSEIEVQRILSERVGSKERKDLFTLLRKKGNYLINSEICTKPVKKPTFPDITKCLPCTHCLGYYSAKQLWRHRKTCIANQSSKTSNHQSDAQNFLIRHLQIDHELKETVFPRMRADQISLVAKRDPLICAFGARYIKIHREKHFINVTSRKMRELSKLLIEIQTLDTTIKNLFHALHPKNFDLFVRATKTVAKYNAEKEHYESPTYAMNIGTSLKQCCEIAIEYALKKQGFYETVQPGETEADLKTMIQLFESHWKFDISSQAADYLNMRKWLKITLAESLDDPEKDLIDSPEENYGISQDDTTSEFTYSNYGQQSVGNDGKAIGNNHILTGTNKKRILVRWTAEQKQLVKTFFKSHITKNKPPKKIECDNLLQQHPDILGNKSWLKIKVFVQNEYTKKNKL